MPENTSQLRAQDLMTVTYAKADVKDTISSLMATMKKANTETAFVFDGKKFAGVVSATGLLRNVDLQKTKVATVVQTVPKLEKKQSFDAIARLMKNANAHLLPVLEGERVIGSVSAQSMLSRMKGNESMQRLRAKEIATMQPITAKENDGLGKVLRQLKQQNVRKIPVLNEKGKLTGVLKVDNIAFEVLLPMERNTDDAYKLKNSSQSISKGNIFGVPVKSVMDENPVLVRGDEKGGNVAEMLSKQSNPLLIMVDNGMHGMISVQNVFTAYLNQAQQTEREEESQIQTTHLPDLDEIDKTKINSMLSKTFGRVQRTIKGEVGMRVVYKQSKKSGLRAKTEVNITLQAAGRPFSAHASDWKVLLATKEACNSLEAEVVKRFKGRREG